MTPVTQKILRRIRGKGRGWVFTPQDFCDLTARDNAGKILYRLARAGHIRHLSRGLYDYPRKHPKIGDCASRQDDIAAAVARATGDRIWPTGAYAANALGLTTQVPANPWFITTGKPKTIRIGDKLVIRLYKATLPKTLTHYGAYLALQALDNLGPRIVDQKMVDKCAKILKPADKKDIRKNMRHIKNPWLADIARLLIGDPATGKNFKLADRDDSYQYSN